MAFSNRRVVELVQREFVPVWERVCEVRIAEFDLGDGRSVKGTVGGEIALYFCRPDGKVFDVLPALQSPAVTYEAIGEAARFYRESGGAPDSAITTRHRDKLREYAEKGLYPHSAFARLARAHGKLNARLEMGAPPQDVMTLASLSKIGMPGVTPIMVVEPGGLPLYEVILHEILATNPPRAPMEWKEVVFEGVLGQELVGGPVRLDVDTVVPMSLIDEGR